MSAKRRAQLSAAHRRMLEKESAIKPSVIKERGYESVNDARRLQRLGSYAGPLPRRARRPTRPGAGPGLPAGVRAGRSGIAARGATSGAGSGVVPPETAQVVE